MSPSDVGMGDAVVIPIGVIGVVAAALYLFWLSRERRKSRSDLAEGLSRRDTAIPALSGIALILVSGLNFAEGRSLVDHARSVWAGPIVWMIAPMMYSGFAVQIGKLTWVELKKLRRYLRDEDSAT